MWRSSPFLPLFYCHPRNIVARVTSGNSILKLSNSCIIIIGGQVCVIIRRRASSSRVKCKYILNNDDDDNNYGGSYSNTNLIRSSVAVCLSSLRHRLRYLFAASQSPSAVIIAHTNVFPSSRSLSLRSPVPTTATSSSKACTHNQHDH